MRLKSLYLKDFRIYKEALFEFDPQVNFIHGANAKGKTTLLEAIYLLIAGSSFRATFLKELIQQQSAAFQVQAIFVNHGIEQKLLFSFDGVKRILMHNQTTLSTTANMIGLLKGVVMTPDDAALVKGGPLLRRKFLDVQLGQIDRQYLYHLVRYNRAMRQRNLLLRAKNAHTIESWEREMALSAAYITLKRQETAVDLSSRTAQIYARLCGFQEQIELKYKSTFPTFEDVTELAERFTELFRQNRSREMHVGTSLYGPHKDDLVITLSGFEARHFASEGQQRTCISAMKIAEWERMREISEEDPLMLVDDVAISLDASRSNQLCQHLQNLEQVFITSTTKHEFARPVFEIFL